MWIGASWSELKKTKLYGPSRRTVGTIGQKHRPCRSQVLQSAPKRSLLIKKKSRNARIRRSFKTSGGLWSRNIPLLAEEGWLRHQKNVAKRPKRRRRGGHTGATFRGNLSPFPITTTAVRD